MTLNPPEDGELQVPVAPTSLPAATGLAAEAIGASVTSPEPAGPTVNLKKWYITLLIVASATLSVAWIAPLSFSLAVRVEQIDAAAKTTALALAVGIPGTVILLTSPLLGVLSDRTRGRFGRRRPWLLVGAVLGLVGSIVTGLAPTVTFVVIGWTIAYIGYTSVGAMIGVHLGDRLPQSQRGKVAGLHGAVNQIAPIVGILLAGSFTELPLAMFLVPAVVAFAGSIMFVLVMKDPPLDHRPLPVNLRSIVEGFYFDPRRHPNLGWVWISRAAIFMAFSIPIYGVYFLSDRLGLDSAAVAGIVASAGIIGVAAGSLGAILSGWLSDKLHRRQSFLFIGALLVGAGLLTVATMTSATQYIAGSLVMVFGIGVYGAVDQALVFDVLPQEERQNGRYLAIVNLANQVPQAAGPFLAGAAISLFAGDYMWLYVLGTAFAVIGGLLILPVRLARRPQTVEAMTPA